MVSAALAIIPGNERESSRRCDGAKMPKYYIESGWMRMVLDARSPKQAAVRAFQRCRERQAKIAAIALGYVFALELTESGAA
jgi:hypothetical protein